MTLTVLSFIGGILWGWLYGRRPTLVGVTISHVIIGVWVLKILSIQGLLVTGPFAQ